MAELAAQGLAVLMVSSEIPEIVGMSDRVVVMREGRIAARLDGPDITPERLVREAAGYADTPDPRAPSLLSKYSGEREGLVRRPAAGPAHAPASRDQP
ncbi:MAG: hypothetical protein AAF264_09315, partial [Pseudomonadota bacterium]